MMLFTILAVTIPAAILNGNGVKVSFPTCVLNAMQCFAGVGAFFPFTGLLLYLPLPVKNEARLTILCTDAMLWIINPALSIALLPAGTGRNGKFCVNLLSPPILGMNRSLYRMLLENETSRAVRESGHIAHNADGVSLSRLTAAYLPSCRSASGHV